VSNDPLTLILLAAGLGTRFGGPKQLAPVGPAGEPLLVVTARQAAHAGFGRLVVVTRSELRDRIDEALAMLGPRDDDPTPLIEVAGVVHQDEHGPARDVPWGTGHAVAVSAPFVTGPCGVANADDYYGDPSFDVLAEWLRRAGADDSVIVGFPLGATLSPHGGVARGVCHATDGRIDHLAEHRGLRREGDKIVDDDGETFDDDTVVSMNLWGLPAWVPAALAERFEAFHDTADGAELMLPVEIDVLRRAGRTAVSLVTSPGRWAGLTFADDLPEVRRAVAADAAHD